MFYFEACDSIPGKAVGLPWLCWPPPPLSRSGMGPPPSAFPLGTAPVTPEEERLPAQGSNCRVIKKGNR